MAVLNHHGAHRKGRCRAQDRADVVRIGHLVEHQHGPHPVLALRHAAAGRGKIDRRQRCRLQHDALMHGALWQQGGDVLAGDDLRCIEQGAGSERKRAGVRPLGELRCALLRRDQPVAAAARIGKRGGDRVGAVEPLAAGARLGALLLMRAPAPGSALARAARTVACHDVPYYKTSIPFARRPGTRAARRALTPQPRAANGAVGRHGELLWALTIDRGCP